MLSRFNSVDIEANYSPRMHFTLAAIIILMLANVCTVLWQFQGRAAHLLVQPSSEARLGI